MGVAALAPVPGTTAAGRAGLAALGALPTAGVAFTQGLRAESIKAMRASGIDLTDEAAVRNWPRQHAEAAHGAVERSLQTGFANWAGSMTGHLTAERFGELIGLGAGYFSEKALGATRKPKEER